MAPATSAAKASRISVALIPFGARQAKIPRRRRHRRKADTDPDARCPEHHAARHPDSRRGPELTILFILFLLRS
jgi:hypothetical protein